ncbi:MAG: hypothetical protein ACI83O_000425 [Patescibacteria group bacterium]|jgi:hypothetical protein
MIEYRNLYKIILMVMVMANDPGFYDYSRDWLSHEKRALSEKVDTNPS